MAVRVDVGPYGDVDDRTLDWIVDRSRKDPAVFDGRTLSREEARTWIERVRPPDALCCMAFCDDHGSTELIELPEETAPPDVGRFLLREAFLNLQYLWDCTCWHGVAARYGIEV